MTTVMKTKDQWLSEFTNSCYKTNRYEFHPYGSMVVKPNMKEVICFYPIMSKYDDSIHSFVVNTFKIKRLDENTWYRECANYNYAENCTRHRVYNPDKAYKIYSKYVDSK
jgi:hypothetical protein